jgi:hypothetical protein
MKTKLVRIVWNSFTNKILKSREGLRDSRFQCEFSGEISRDGCHWYPSRHDEEFDHGVARMMGGEMGQSMQQLVAPAAPGEGATASHTDSRCSGFRTDSRKLANFVVRQLFQE